MTQPAIPDGPIRRRDLVAQSSRGRADRAVARGEADRLLHGVLGPSGSMGSLIHRARAAVSTQRVGVVSHWTAVAIYGWEVLGGTRAIEDIDLTVPPKRTTASRRGLRFHESDRHPGRRVVRGVPVAGAARTVMDIVAMPDTTVVAGVCLAEAAMRANDVSIAELQAEADTWSGRRGAVKVREVLRLVRPGARSCPETFARVTLELAGMKFTPAYCIAAPGGGTLYEGDLADEDLLLWLEYDGFLVHSEWMQFRRDRKRIRFIGRRGWRVLPFTDEVLADPHAFVAEVAEERRMAVKRVRGLPWGLSPEADRAKRRLGCTALS